MPNQTETSDSDEADSTTPRWRQRLVRLWDSGIPLWQKLLVWAGAASVAWMTVQSFVLLRVFDFITSRTEPLYQFDGERIVFGEWLEPASDALVVEWLAVSLTLSFGLWIWPWTYGRWRIFARVLAAPATLGFLILFPFVGYFWLLSVVYAGEHPDFGVRIWLNAIMPPFVYPALYFIWIGPVRAWRARRTRSAN